MSTPKPNGGPAFPNSYIDNTKPHIRETVVADGMTLRDYFAGQALAGMLAHPDTKLEIENLTELMVLGPWAIADAMIAARKKSE